MLFLLWEYIEARRLESNENFSFESLSFFNFKSKILTSKLLEEDFKKGYSIRKLIFIEGIAIE